MFISTDRRLETEQERQARVQATMEVLSEICRECDCTPLDVAEALGFELSGSRIVN
jgi:hypothetical protein